MNDDPIEYVDVPNSELYLEELVNCVESVTGYKPRVTRLQTWFDEGEVRIRFNWLMEGVSFGFKRIYALFDLYARSAARSDVEVAMFEAFTFDLKAELEKAKPPYAASYISPQKASSNENDPDAG